jgi:1-acyl-sn-glycerol-3-phosphate acyltransferase
MLVSLVNAPANTPATNRPLPFRKLMAYVWYEIAYVISMAVLSLGFSLRYKGRRNIPRSGAALLIANHQSFLDPLAVGLAAPRHLCFLARKTLFKNRFFGNLLASLKSVPVDQQGVAKDGMRAILDRMATGEAVLVFPEGERTWTGKMQPLKPGIQLLIKRTQAPIIPVGVAGAYDALPRTRAWPILSPLFLPPTRGSVAVVVGRPLDARRFAEMPREEMLAELFKEMQKVQQEAEKLRRK